MFSKKIDYAIFLLDELRKIYPAKTPLNIHAVSEKYGLPKPFLEKIAAELKEAGLIRAVKGRNGGYLLAKDPKNLNLQDIISVFQEEEASSCTGCAYADFCPTKEIKNKVSQKIEKVLKNTNL